MNELREQCADVELVEELKKFYNVGTLHDVIRAQSRHIERLQARLPPDNVAPFNRPREG